MSPSKLELLTAWLPTRPWYRDSGRAPQLSKAGGFRLDDPAGSVGIEFVLVNDSAGPESITYHVPLTYRGAPLDGAEDALVGTSIHGVLGQRWIYDATRDPVAVAQIAALLAGQAQPQAQSASDTPDPSVVVSTIEFPSAATEFGSSVEGSTCTDIAVGSGRNIRVERVLRLDAPNSTVAPHESAAGSQRPDTHPDSSPAPEGSTSDSRRHDALAAAPNSGVTPVYAQHPDRLAEVPSTDATLANSESADSRHADEPISGPHSARVAMPWQDVTGSTVHGVVLAIDA
ncbi:maltokinase N-terminal cap-like domain-containing protein [Nocardia sp. CA-135398]|uniref:maltokinase N-terminal cap-like domain-containing protein n=1 Tax=Nocardia sp. CA-135398 TaxID=3239977 RepID=UPI003D9994D4